MNAPATIKTSSPVTVDTVAAQLRPLTRQIDEDGGYPAEIMRKLGEAGAYRHHADGAGLSNAVNDMIDVAAICGTTGFSMWCQDALVWYLANSKNQDARSRYLADAANGRLLGGTGLSNPMKALAGIETLALTGTPCDGGYRVRGRLPFVSNVQDGHVFAGIFQLQEQPDRLVMAIFRAGTENVTLARNAHFIGLEGSATYSVLIRDAFVPAADVLSDDARSFVAEIRSGFVLLQTGFGMGVARGAARSMREDSVGRRPSAHLPLGPDQIDARCETLLERVRSLAQNHQSTGHSLFLDVLRLRLDVSWLALEAAQSAMLQFGARGYLVNSEPARRLREAQFVAIVTPSVKHITSELAKHHLA
jgi:alkylation response protein AidB-like acyl-CoA dehydrogenase